MAWSSHGYLCNGLFTRQHSCLTTFRANKQTNKQTFLQVNDGGGGDGGGGDGGVGGGGSPDMCKLLVVHLCI